VQAGRNGGMKSLPDTVTGMIYIKSIVSCPSIPVG
jgi:hypothetical protein